MIEPEMAFADLNTNADLAEAFLQGVISEVLEECAEDSSLRASSPTKILFAVL